MDRAFSLHLDQAGICVSTGSACHSTTHESSPTLRAMNVPYTAAQGSIRFSLGRFNTGAEIDTTLSVLPEIIAKLAAMSPYEEELIETEIVLQDLSDPFVLYCLTARIILERAFTKSNEHCYRTPCHSA